MSLLAEQQIVIVIGHLQKMPTFITVTAKAGVVIPPNGKKTVGFTATRKTDVTKQHKSKYYSHYYLRFSW